jgi:hypothetical protein
VRPILDYGVSRRGPRPPASPVWAAIAIPAYGLLSLTFWWGVVGMLFEGEVYLGGVVGAVAIIITARLWAAVRYALGVARLSSRE